MLAHIWYTLFCSLFAHWFSFTNNTTFICSSPSFFTWYAQRPMTLWIHNPTSKGALQECRQASFKACKNADKLRTYFWEPSGRRLANFVRPRASPPRTTKNKLAHCCTPIIDGKKFLSWTPKCYLRRSWAQDPEDSKNDPLVRARERQVDRETSLVVSRGHISWLMVGLLALTRQKQLAKSRQATSQPASQR